MAGYATKQRKLLLDFFKKHVDEPLSAAQIVHELLGEQGEGQDTPRISVSAVYRNLSALEQEGTLLRCVKNGEREACFRYTDAIECTACVHLTCSRCGRTFHLDAPVSDRIAALVQQAQGFSVDRCSSMLYGVCAQCTPVTVGGGTTI